MAYTSNRGKGLNAQPTIIYQHDMADGNFDPLNDTTLPKWVRQAFSNGFMFKPVQDGTNISFMPFGNMKNVEDYVTPDTTLPTDTDKIITYIGVPAADFQTTLAIAVYTASTTATSIIVGVE